MFSVAQVIGVDAHKDSFTFVRLCGGVKAGQGSLPNNREGYRLLGERVGRAGGDCGPVFAIENARGYALGLSCHLLGQGRRVYDIPATQVAGLRRRRNRAKNDLEDALQAARTLLEDAEAAQR